MKKRKKQFLAFVLAFLIFFELSGLNEQIVKAANYTISGTGSVITVSNIYNSSPSIDETSEFEVNNGAQIVVDRGTPNKIILGSGATVTVQAVLSGDISSVVVYPAGTIDNRSTIAGDINVYTISNVYNDGTMGNVTIGSVTNFSNNGSAGVVTIGGGKFTMIGGNVSSLTLNNTASAELEGGSIGTLTNNSSNAVVVSSASEVTTLNSQSAVNLNADLEVTDFTANGITATNTPTITVSGSYTDNGNTANAGNYKINLANEDVTINSSAVLSVHSNVTGYDYSGVFDPGKTIADMYTTALAVQADTGYTLDGSYLLECGKTAQYTFNLDSENYYVADTSDVSVVTPAGDLSYTALVEEEEDDSGIVVTLAPSVTTGGAITVPADSSITLKLPALAEKGEQAAPTGLVGDVYSIKGTDTTLEYAPYSDTPVYTSCTGSTTEVSAPGTYLVRKKATRTLKAGTPATVKVLDTFDVNVVNPSGSGLVLSEGSATSQSVAEGSSIQTINYIADDDHYIPEDYSLTKSGITVTRNNYRTIKVSGKPTGDVTVTLPVATEKSEQAAPNVVANGKALKGTTEVMEYAASKTAAVWTTCANIETPVEDGTWYVRYAATETKKAGATTEVKIGEAKEEKLIPVPADAYTLTGMMGLNEFYVSNVVVTAKDGYLLSESLDGSYTKSITYSETKQATNLYFKNIKTGERTVAAVLPAFKIDKTEPALSENDDLIYADEMVLDVSDLNLADVTLDGNSVKIIDNKASLTLNSDDGKKIFTIAAKDLAGNSIEKEITVCATWMMNDFLPNGVTVLLETQTAYKLESGTWTVSDDATRYVGGREIYVKDEGKRIFNKQ